MLCGDIGAFLVRPLSLQTTGCHGRSPDQALAPGGHLSEVGAWVAYGLHYLLSRIDESGKGIVGIANSIHDIVATIRSPLAPTSRLLGRHLSKSAVRRKG